MEDYITREEHEEFRRRMEEHHARQDKRLALLEEAVRDNQALTVSVGRLADSTDRMSKELEKQGKRLDSLESRDGEKWRSVVSHVVTAVVTAVVAFLLARFGL